MKTKKFPLIAIAILAVLVLGAYGIRAYIGKHPKQGEASMLGTTVTTSYGVLTLVYQNGTTALMGELARQTPCVNWQAATTRSENKIAIAIADASKDAVCVQTLGTPQAVHETVAGTGPSSVYAVTLAGTTVFEGTLSAVSLPSAPTDGKAQ